MTSGRQKDGHRRQEKERKTVDTKLKFRYTYKKTWGVDAQGNGNSTSQDGQKQGLWYEETLMRDR